MSKVRPGLSNDLRNRFDLRAHGLRVQNDLEARRGKRFYEFNSFGGGIDEVCFPWTQRFQTNRHTAVFCPANRFAERLHSPFSCLLYRTSGHDVPLLGRADNHPVTAEVSAKVHQVAKVVRGPLSDRAIGMVDIKSLRLHQHPMNAGDLDADPCGGFAYPLAVRTGNISDGIRQSERGNFETAV